MKKDFLKFIVANIINELTTEKFKNRVYVKVSYTMCGDGRSHHGGQTKFHEKIGVTQFCAFNNHELVRKIWRQSVQHGDQDSNQCG